MIDAVFLKNGVQWKGFRISGHARYAKHGRDVVCSAVSAVAQMTLVGLLEVVKADAEYEIDDGGELSFTLCDGNTTYALEQSQLLIETLHKTMCNMQHNYSGHLRVSEREETQYVI